MIGIVDYGVGNIKAVANIYNRLNINHFIIKKPEDFVMATRIILPGVGAFDFAMDRLEKSGLKEILSIKVLKDKIPILGICVGMQMLANSSEEGMLPGLGWIPGQVKKFDMSYSKQSFPLPHMGWNSIKPVIPSTLFNNLEVGCFFYFLHSYYFQCDDTKHILSRTCYGEEFASVIQINNIYGIQCHPEKSHQNGINFLKNFAELP